MPFCCLHWCRPSETWLDDVEACCRGEGCTTFDSCFASCCACFNPFNIVESINPLKSDPACIALLIGIEYGKTRVPLEGCVNDLKSTYNVATKKFGLKLKKVYVGVENPEDCNFCEGAETFYPNLENLKSYLTKVVKDADPETMIYFHFSGRGTRTRDLNGDEVDGKDEGIITSDLKIISDDFLNSLISDKTKMFAIMDCCHSESIWDVSSKTPGKVVTFAACEDDQTAYSADGNEGATVGLFSSSIGKELAKRDTTIFSMIPKMIQEIRNMTFTNLQSRVQNIMDASENDQTCILSKSDPNITCFSDIIQV